MNIRNYAPVAVRWFLMMALVASTLLPAGASTVFAGKAGVFINSKVYFTLDNASISKSSDDQTVKFAITLVNGSSATVNYNAYGARLADAKGNNYSAEIVQKSAALVAAGKSVTYEYKAQVPSTVSADQLKVVLFAWDFSQQKLMRDLGSLSVAASLTKETGNDRVTLDLSDIDDTLSADSDVTFQVERSFRAFSAGTWYLYVNLIAENNSSESIKLPAKLAYDVKDGAGLVYSTSSVTGPEQTLQPHQRIMLNLQIPYGDGSTTDSLILELLEKSAAAANGNQGTGSGSSGTNGSSGNSGTSSSSSSSSTSAAPTVLASLQIPSSAGTAKLNEKVTIAKASGAALTMVAERFAITTLTDGNQITGTFKLANESAAPLALPNVTATYQLPQTTLSIEAADRSYGSRPAYLASGESATYSFTATLPKGIDASKLQLVVRDSSVKESPSVVGIFEVTSTTSSSATKNVDTPVGKLSFNLNATYRLKTATGDDVVMSEIEVKNSDSKIVSLPSADSLYGAYRIGTFDADGSAVYLQTSPLLNPGQTAIVYVYAKVPYDTEIGNGYVILGSSSGSGAAAQKTQWTELAYKSQSDASVQTGANSEWIVNAPGRVSTGKVVESKVYTVGTQKLLAVRIEQTGKATRNGQIVPYTGYAENAGGSVNAVTTTSTAGSLCAECKALTTLWMKLPGSASSDGWQFVFGPQINGSIFSDPRQYAFEATAETGSVSGSQISGASLYPYKLNFTNGKIMLNDAGNMEVSFDYWQTQSADVAGADENRSLLLVLKDGANATLKTWEFALEASTSAASDNTGGTLAKLENDVNNKLSSLPLSAIPDLQKLYDNPQLEVYEKFAGATRLIGTMNLALY